MSGYVTRGCVEKRVCYEGVCCVDVLMLRECIMRVGVLVGRPPSINGKTLSKDPRSRNSNANTNSRYILSQGVSFSNAAIRCNAPREINGMKILLFNMPLKAATSHGSPGSKLVG